MNLSALEQYTSPFFIDRDFDDPILYDPARMDRTHPCNSLKIVTGYLNCDRISTHMIALSEGIEDKTFRKDITVDIILGMAKSSLTQKKHQDICRLVEELNSTHGMPKVHCYYVIKGKEVHSKVYVWSSNTSEDSFLVPETAFCGSLNYTMEAFYKRRETVFKCSPSSAKQYFDRILEDCIECTSLTNEISFSSKPPANTEIEGPDNSEEEYEEYNRKPPLDQINISWLMADGSGTGYGSGPNWGIRQNGTPRNPNQAYIPYNSQDKKPGFFPERRSPLEKNAPMFKVLTKEIGAFHMRIAQQGDKALESVESNAILGKWVRDKLGLPFGTFVTLQHFQNYGRTYVTFRKYDDNVYLLDF